MAYQTTNIYKEKVYNEDARHKLKISFNGVEYPNIDNVCEKLTINSRIIPNGNTNFALDNFISKEATLILHNVALEDIVDPVEIQIGTLTNSENETYEYVPMGIFNIQDIPTTDKDKTTITLRDNAVKFDFPYNAQPLIEGNGGSVTKLDILNDICTQANVENNIETFFGSDELIGNYDNSITGRQYIAYLAEQAGAIATINRYGILEFIYLDNLVEQELPLQYIESYQNGDEYEITRVAYEDAIRKFENPTEEESEKDTLYLNSANPYISNQNQIENIYNILNGFKINSFKTGKVLGNPAIDPYDIIVISDSGNTYKTLATNTLTYNGKLIQTFDTQISIANKQSNVSLVGEPSFRKFAKTNIDNINNNIEQLVVEQNETSQRLSQTIQDVNNIQNLFQITGGNNLIKDSQLLLKDEGLWQYGDVSSYSLFPSSNIYPSTILQPIEYYYNNPDYIGGYDSTLIGKTVSVAKIGICNGKMKTTPTNITNLIVNQMYSISFKITNNENTNTKIKLIGNGNVVYEQTFDEEVNMQTISYSFIALTSSYTLEIQSTSTTNGYTYIYDLMLNKGDVQTWEPASGELVSTVIKLSQLGLQVYSTGSEIATLMTSEGFGIYGYQNGNITANPITKFDRLGMSTSLVNTIALLVNNFQFKQIKYQGYDTLVLYKKESD